MEETLSSTPLSAHLDDLLRIYERKTTKSRSKNPLTSELFLTLRKAIYLSTIIEGEDCKTSEKPQPRRARSVD
jgi:hypothetical protein